MRLTATVLAALLLCAAASTVRAQEPEKSRPTLMGSNAEGFHFMVGFMQNEMWEELQWCPWDSAYQSISISSKFGAKVTITEPDGRITEKTVRAYEVYEHQIDPRYECIGEGIFQNAIEIRSDRPISVSCYSSKPETSDGYLALPISSWGTDYISANYFVDHYRPMGRGDICAVYPRAGEFAVIAAYDNTVVTVVPSTVTLSGVAAGATMRRVLRRGEILQVQDGGETRRSDWALGSDLTGSIVTADKPVGFLSGHVRSGVTTLYESKDHLIEMLPPRTAMGRRYMTVPFGGRLGGDLVRVISTTALPTRVTVTSASRGVTTSTMATIGSFIDIDIFDPVEILADQPVLVTQYARSAGSDPRNNESLRIWFDPDMVVLTPVEQYVNGAIFATPSDTNQATGAIQFNAHFVTIVAERSSFASVKLNGVSIATMPTVVLGDMPGANYVWATVEIAEQSTHVLSGEGMFAGYLYGLGRYDSYAWPIGSGLRPISAVDDDPPMMLSRPICGGVEIIALDSGMTQNGLRAAWLDTTVSVNATFTPVPLTLGDEMSIGIVRAVDARQQAFARIWTEDLGGRRTYLDVTLAPSAPAFSSETLSMGNVEIGKSYNRPFTIANNGSAPVTIERMYLVRGREYLLEQTFEGITLAPDGGQLTLKIHFLASSLDNLTDTLVLVIDCREYRIPIIALAAAPRIATNGWDFGRVRLGRTGGPGQILVINTGDADLVIDSAAIVGATFSKRNELRWPVRIAPGGDTLALEVFFQPTATTSFTGAVRFYSNVPDSVATGTLTGRGVYPTLSILGHDFGRVQLGDTLCTVIPVANIGSDTAYLTGLDLPNPASYSYDRGAFPHALPEGDTLWVAVCFSPTEETSYITDVSPRNDDDLTAMNSLRGVGYRPRAALGGADMGRLWIGETHDSVVYVTNIGTDPITITRVWLEGGDVGDFIVEPLDAEQTIAPGGRLPVNVHFSPLQAGHREAYIHAETASRFQPQLDSVLIGFGLFALSSDQLTFDDSLAYSCEQRSGRLVITNEGNTQLTIATLEVACDPPIMTIDAPEPGYVIAVGESLVLDFTLDFSGYTGVTQASITWSFEEPPNLATRREFSREISIESRPQQYAASAWAPPQVIPGEVFELTVRVDSAAWKSIGEKEVRVEVEYDPTMTVFDEATWRNAVQLTGPWHRGTARWVAPARIEVQFLSATGEPIPLAGSALPTIPFRAYLGAREHDSLRATIIAFGNECAAPALAGAGIGLDSICGLSVRLFEFTGAPFVLRQNQPNPVRDRTEILFTLAMDAATRLELFAADGRLVRVLVDETLDAGDYTIVVDAATIGSGAYYYRLTSGPFSAIRSMQIAQ